MVRVVLVEEMRLVRGGLVALLMRHADIDVVGDFGWDEGIVSQVAELLPDVAVINTETVAGELFSVVADLQAKANCAILVLVDPRKPFVLPPRMSTRSLSFLDKDSPPGELAECVGRVAGGGQIVAPPLMVAAVVGAENRLTGRELEVLRLAAEGAAVSEIAQRLYLSLGTVRNYLSAVTAKTGARNRIDAIRIAREYGWLW
jgi:two-component system response regulator DesR